MKSILVIGTGRFGRYMIATLSQLGHEVLAIDRNEDKIGMVLPYVAHAEIGDSTNENFLAELGIDEFDLCIVAIGDDFMSSLETTLLLKDLADYIELPNDYVILKVRVPEEWQGQTIGELNVRSEHEIVVLGVEDADLNMDITVNAALRAGENVLVMGKYDQLKQVFNM